MPFVDFLNLNGTSIHGKGIQLGSSSGDGGRETWGILTVAQMLAM